VRVGVHLIGDDYANTPPAHALSSRGIIDNVVGFRIYGDYSEENPPARMIEAVAAGDVEVAVAWGPLAGYFARRSPVPLEVVPVSPQIDLPFLPMVYDISMGVRREDVELKEEVERILAARQPEVEAILDEFAIPRLAAPGRERRP